MVGEWVVRFYVGLDGGPRGGDVPSDGDATQTDGRASGWPHAVKRLGLR